MLKHDIDTPALILDLDVMEQNIAAMAAYFRDRPQELRPHFKTPKTPEIDLTTQWTNTKDRFSIVNVRLVVNGRVVARADGTGANKLPVRVSRTKRSVSGV